MSKVKRVFDDDIVITIKREHIRKLVDNVNAPGLRKLVAQGLSSGDLIDLAMLIIRDYVDNTMWGEEQFLELPIRNAIVLILAECFIHPDDARKLLKTPSSGPQSRPPEGISIDWFNTDSSIAPKREI